MAQTTLTRLPLQCAPSSISSAQPQIRAQNVSIMQNPMFQKMAVNRPILTLNRQGLIPVQVSQGHTIILNSIAQSSSVKHPILPKGASPEKITTQSNLKPVYVPLSSTLTVRPIAPRSGTSVAAGGDNDKKKPQHQVCTPFSRCPDSPKKKYFLCNTAQFCVLCASASVYCLP